MIPPLLRTLATGSIVLLGGAISISALTTSVLRRKALINKEKFGKLCLSCRGKGFYKCKLCKANGTIKWSPLYDPVFVNPCVCPTCEGNKIQRCLNCLGDGRV
ncbi:hypothetical protein AABB24_026223 [Solanum stoloniferum]|uniref:Uncharacterized protein n=2 Tax=Solanum TaxID=4107 RepID=A0AAV9M9F8_9SOLN|nr:hypothetical protein R3W88_008788 [Solanum pinnatisectum]